MKKPTDEQIREIAEKLDAGLMCYFNHNTGELRMVSDRDGRRKKEESRPEEEDESIDRESGGFMEFERLSAEKELRIMADFTENLGPTDFKQKLKRALARPKPFRVFKNEIDNAGEFRMKWFAYRKKRYVDWVKDQVKEFFSD